MFVRPPVSEFRGRERRVGFELEFHGPEIESVAEALGRRLGARPHAQSRFAYLIEHPELGEFRLEYDARFLKQGWYIEYLEKLGIEIRDPSWREDLDRWVERLSAELIPQELVTPPLPLSQLELADQLREELQVLGAKGTRESAVYAFGLHLNPELWSEEVVVLRRVLQAFMLVYDALVPTMNWSRRIGPHVSDFTEAHRKHVLRPDFDPSLDEFVETHLRYSPTRNRALDLLPALKAIHPNADWESLEEPGLVKARPAFHYRLPDSRVDEPSWSLAEAWSSWVQVERLATDPDRLEHLIERYVEVRAHNPIGFRRAWRRHAEETIRG
jgi:hypothetical protein